MRVIDNDEKVGARIVALGTFDGVHKGHAALLQMGREYADRHGILLRAYTFDRHPMDVLCPSQTPGTLSTPHEKIALMERLGTDELRVLPFTADTAKMEPTAFIDLLQTETELKAVIAGWNYTYGSMGAGNPDTLRAAAAARGFDVLIVDPVSTDDGRHISSTEIRRCIVNGDMRSARAMLGYDYSLTGIVVSGKGVGRRIGFPTANIRQTDGKLLPANGVYICRLEENGMVYEAVADIGFHPTLPTGGLTVEAHVLHACPDLYGRTVRLAILERIRDEKQFSTETELSNQIRTDTELAEKWFRMDRTDEY